MNDFISLENTGENYSFFFNSSHMFIIFSSLLLIAFFMVYYERQSRKSQRIFVGITTALLVLLEGARIYWRYLYLSKNGESLSFLSITGLDFFTLSLWISIPLLIVGVIIMGKRDYAFGLNFIFSVGSLAAVITLIYPVGLNSNFPFYHCYNLIWLLERTFLCMLGFILAVSKWISAREFLDLWAGILSLGFFGGVCVFLNVIVGWKNNLFYVARCPIFEELSIYLPFPIHFLLLGAFLIMFQLILFLPFRLFERRRNKLIEQGKYHN